MAEITPVASPTVKLRLRKLYMDDGSKPNIALDMVDVTNQVILDNFAAIGANLISTGTGAPAAAATAPGSVYIRTDGASAAEVIYVNHDGLAGSWLAVAP